MELLVLGVVVGLLLAIATFVAGSFFAGCRDVGDGIEVVAHRGTPAPPVEPEPKDGRIVCHLFDGERLVSMSTRRGPAPDRIVKPHGRDHNETYVLVSSLDNIYRYVKDAHI